jgi:competence protein ComFC
MLKLFVFGKSLKKGFENIGQTPRLAYKSKKMREEKMKNLMDFLIRLIYPPRCIFCESLLEMNEEIDICSKCFHKVHLVQNHWMDTEKLHFEYCQGAICLFVYEGLVKESLLRYKFKKKPDLYRAFSKLMIQKLDSVNFRDFDVVISVPLSKESFQKRGFNQSYLISQYLSHYYGKPDLSNLVKKTRNTQAQSSVGKALRKSNVKGIFRIESSNQFHGKRVLIIDDIITTGSTVDELSKEVLNFGAVSVYVITIAGSIKQDYWRG